MSYQLIILDIDGTLLNSRKEIPEETMTALRRVCAAGKTVAFGTGRAVPELKDLIDLLPEIRYAVFASGAGLYDTHEKKAFGLHVIPSEKAAQILSLVRGKDIMPQLVLPDRVVIQKTHMERLSDFHMSVYRPLYEKAMTLVPDIQAFAQSCREPYLKINLYHTSVGARVQTRSQLECPDLELVYSEVTSVECSAAGVSKGSGLERLCALLHIPPRDVIAVGDADNDIPMLRAAGLGVAMGNAPDYVKASAKHVVSDLDHGGCAQALRLAL